MSDICREPSFYYPSDHAIIRQEERDIPWTKIADTIEYGRMMQSHKDDCKLFLKHFEDDELPVGVVADVTNGEILTVEWRE